MPFDNPRTFTLDLAGLAAWLETQDPDKEYCFLATGDCLLFRFFKAQGAPVYSMAGTFWRDTLDHRIERPLDEHLRTAAVERPHTYGAALERARALLDPRG